MKIRALLAAAAVLLATTPASAQTWSVQADEMPTSRPWTDPARLAYTFNNDGDDSYAADFAVRFEDGLPWARGENADGWFVRGVGHLNNQQSKRQERLALETGLHFEGFVGNAYTSDNQPTGQGLFWNIDVSVGYNREAVYADDPPPICDTSPELAFCDTQHKESIRVLGAVDIFHPSWERTFSYRTNAPATAGGEAPERRIEGRALAYSFQPVVTFFYDEVTNAPVDPATLTQIDGAVSGVQLRVGGAVSPRWQDYRLVLRGSYTRMEAFDRDSGRRSTFPQSADLLSLSLDYEFGERAFDPTASGWSPSIGVTYTQGEDPLNGRRDQDTVVLALKLAYRGS